MTGTFSILDGIILFTYLVVVLSMGFYYSRRQDKDTVSYFLAGRSMGWFTIGLSIFATNISSEHFIGLAGSGATRGLAVGHFELLAIFILVLLGWFITPLYMRSGVQTIPEFLGKRFDEKSRKFFAGLSIFLYIFTKVTVTLFAGGILFYKLFGINIYASAIIIVLITGIYTVIGGETSVMKTHVIQAVMMILGAVLMTGFGLAEVGGMHALKQKLPVDFFTLFKPMSDPDYPWTGIIFGAPIIAFWYWCTDQYIVQRILSARNIQEARKGSLLAAFLKLTPMFILVLPGLIAIALFPEIKGDDAYPTMLLSNIIPTGIKGLILTGVVAAIMSSLASVFNSTSAIFTNDFYKPKFPEASEAKLVLIARLSTMVVVILAILCVPLVKFINSQVYLYIQGLQAYVAPPITAVFLFGLLSRKITSKAVFWTLILGEGIGFFRLLLDMAVNLDLIEVEFLHNITHINFLHFAIFLFVVSTAALFILSYVFREKSGTETSEEIYDNMQVSEGTAVKAVGADTLKQNILFSFTLLVIVAGLLGVFFS